MKSCLDCEHYVRCNVVSFLIAFYKGYEIDWDDLWEDSAGKCGAFMGDECG